APIRSTEWHFAQCVRTKTRPLCAGGESASSALAICGQEIVKEMIVKEVIAKKVAIAEEAIAEGTAAQSARR
ncbi:MAG: hypothetical protein ACLP19_24920, partial [Xanthobacteraceae bacterium]